MESPTKTGVKTRSSKTAVDKEERKPLLPWPHTDKLQRKIDEQLAYAKQHGLTTTYDEEAEDGEEPNGMEEDEDDQQQQQEDEIELLKVVEKKPVKQVLKKKNKRKLGELEMNNLTHPQKRNKTLKVMHERNRMAKLDEASKRTVWLRTKATMLSYAVGTSDNYFLEDLEFWSQYKELHYYMWAIIDMFHVPYPTEEKWREAEARKQAKEAGLVMADNDEEEVVSQLRGDALIARAHELASDPNFTLEAKQNIAKLELWVSDRSLHRCLWNIWRPAKAYPSEAEWEAAKEVQTMMKKKLFCETRQEKKQLKTIIEKILRSSPEQDHKIILTYAKEMCRVNDTDSFKDGLTDLTRWYFRQELHTAIWKMLYPNDDDAPPPNACDWAKAHLEIQVLQRERAEEYKKKQEKEEEKDVLMTKLEEGTVVDLSESKHGPKGPMTSFILGEGFSLVNNWCHFNQHGQYGTYEAVSLVKTMPPDEKTKQAKALSINMPIRTLSALRTSLKTMKESMAEMTSLPSIAEISNEMKSMPIRQMDLSSCTDTVPKITFKLDELLSVKGEVAKWGKAFVEVITFTRHAKTQAKKDFSMQLPVKYFPALERAVDFIYQAHGLKPVVNM